MYASSVAVPRVRVDLSKKSPAVSDFETSLRRRIVNQDAAVNTLVRTYQLTRGGIRRHDKPLANLLFAGPTGVGKTFLFECAAETLFGSPTHLVKVDCAEFQHSHEIAKLIGSPPGYLGHRETPAMLAQYLIDQYQTDKDKVTFVVFDEIEKANESLWQLLLGIMDKGVVTLGDGKVTRMNNCIIGMTTNLGAAEMHKLSSGTSIGLVRQTGDLSKVQAAADKAVHRNFSPEFMNRVDETVIFNSLTPKDMHNIVSRELSAVQTRISATKGTPVFFILRWTNDVLRTLLDRSEKTESYGARPLKRVIERDVVVPLSIALSTEQIPESSTVLLSVDNDEIVLDVLSSKPALK